MNFANAGLIGALHPRRPDVEEQAQDPAQEAKRLQCCINDLVGVLALPAIWRGSEPSQIVQTLLDVLLRMLGLEFAYARLNDAFDAMPVEVLRVAECSKINLPPQELRNILGHSLAADAQGSLRQIRSQLGVEEISIFPVPLGIQAEIGVIVIGSKRVGFPEKAESLLLSVAANQASIGLQEARLRGKQERIAAELEQQVAERTRALDQTNAELRKEIAERKLAEQKLRQEEQELKRSEVHKAAILDSSPDCIIAIDHEGHITEYNPAAELTFGHRRSDVLGRPLANVIIPPSLREEHRTGLARYLATGESEILGRRTEMTAVRADGSEFPVELTITRIPQDSPAAFTGHIRDITERKRSEDALRIAHAQVERSEERWRSVFENSAVGVALTDQDGRFIAANPVYQKMLGYTEQELQGLTFTDITHDKNRDQNRMLVGELLEGKRQQFQIEKQYCRKDGTSVSVRNNVSIVPGTERVPRFLMALSEDITERKQAEDKLRASETSLKQIINTMPAMAWSAQADGSAEFVNQRWLDYTGLSAEQAQGWGWAQAVHPDDLGQLKDYWLSTIATGQSGETEARLRRLDGEYRRFLFRASPLRDESRAIVKWYGTNIDIEDRKRAEEALRASELDARSLLDNMPGFLARLSPDGTPDIYNRPFLQYLGATLEEVKNWRTSHFVHLADLAYTIEVFGKGISSGQPFDFQYRLRRFDAVYRWFQARVVPVRNLEGRILHWNALVTDIDERKRAEEELRIAQSELARVMRVMTMGQLTASITHEVNQPLSGIITNASTCLRMLDANPPNVEGARETARRTIRDGNRASDVIKRLRTLYSKKEPALESMDLNEATREVIALSSAEMQKNGVTLRQEFADDLPPALGDRIQLQQVILNLLRNATDAMSTIEDRARELLIRTERDGGDQVRLSVKDSGVGFTPQAADKIFEAFYTTKTEGMGIGLSISRSIIEAHQGHLWATRNDGPGSTFSFSIPCWREGLADAEIRVNATDPSTDAPQNDAA